MAECPHNPFIEAEWCSTCIATSARAVRMELPEPAGAFEARYSGHCAGCNLGYAPGSRIRKTPHETYVHARCPDG